jgi:anaerobic magnesium-protoporphyrin IX monomethyl ester cyclase
MRHIIQLNTQGLQSMNNHQSNHAKPRILLVRVPEVELNSSDDMRATAVSGLAVPLGPAYIASTIRHHGQYDVQILDLYLDLFEIYAHSLDYDKSHVLEITRKTLLDSIEDYNPLIVGFSALFSFQHNFVQELADSVKTHYPEIRIYLGGYATIFPQMVMEQIQSLDVLFIGEAESTVLKVLEEENNSRDFAQISGIAYRDRDKIVINNTLSRVMDLEEIPLPAFDLLNTAKYRQILGRSEFPILTSRSCPFSCNYCSSKLYSGRGLRLRNTDSILNEISYLKKEYQLDLLYIRDELFNGNRKHAKTLLRGMIDRQLNISWFDTNAFHVNSLDEEFLDLCKASGCIEAIFAIESGSPRVLKEIMNKRVDLDHAKKMAEHCRKIDLPIQCYFVIGNPGETKEEIHMTIDFAASLSAEGCVFSIATPFPGTQYYELALEKGFLVHAPEDILRMKYMDVNMETDNFTAQWLKDTQYDANIRVNFLENTCLSSNREGLEKARIKYGRIFQQYDFHVIAAIMMGYIDIKLGDVEKGCTIFAKAETLLQNEHVKKAFYKYLSWDTLPTDTFNKWMQSKISGDVF